MHWVEIIHVRSMESKHEMIHKQLQQLMHEVNSAGDTFGICAFSRFNLKSDHCLHIYHQETVVLDGGSQLGMHLADELKKYGVVNHTIWCRYPD